MFVSSRLELIPTSSWREGGGCELGVRWERSVAVISPFSKQDLVMSSTLQRRIPLNSCRYVTLQELSWMSCDVLGHGYALTMIIKTSKANETTGVRYRLVSTTFIPS